MTNSPGRRDSTSLDGRIALVTGAGSPDGIGFATARLLTARGAQVAIAATTDRIVERAPELYATGFAADLAEWADAGRLAAEVEERVGAVDVLVNTVGWAQIGQPADTSLFTDLEPA